MLSFATRRAERAAAEAMSEVIFFRVRPGTVQSARMGRQRALVFLEERRKTGTLTPRNLCKALPSFKTRRSRLKLV